jgi:hypothetical protein
LAGQGQQRDGRKRRAVSANRAEAGRAGVILVSLAGWKRAAIGEEVRDASWTVNQQSGKYAGRQG